MITLSEKKKKSMIEKWVKKHKAPVVFPDVIKPSGKTTILKQLNT